MRIRTEAVWWLAMPMCLSVSGHAAVELTNEPAALIGLMSSRYHTDRQKAVARVSDLDAETQKAMVPALSKLVEQGGWLAQESAARALQSIGPRAKQAVPGLEKAVVKGIKDRRPAAAFLMLRTLKTIEQNAVKGLVPSIAELLDADDRRVVNLACRMLGELGTEAAATRATLAKLLNSEETDVAVAAAKALSRVGAPPQALKTLTSGLRSKDIAQAVACAEALRTLGRKAEPALWNRDAWHL